MLAEDAWLATWLRLDLWVWPALLAIGWLIASRRPGRAAVVRPGRATPAARLTEPARMGAAVEMQKLSAVVGRAIEQAERMVGAQAAARIHLDAAEHAFGRLVSELDAVMGSKVALSARMPASAPVRYVPAALALAA